MLTLTILPAQSQDRAIPRSADPDAEIWRDHNGDIAGIGQVSGDECWFHLPRLGSFTFGAHTTDVRALPEYGVSSGKIVDAYHRIVVPLALQVRGCEVLHASAVRTAGGIVALCATKETGKSTLAYALHEKGYSLWADDAVAFRTRSGTPEALSLPFRLRLRAPSAAFFGRETAGEGWLDHTAAEPLALDSAPFAGICVLTRSQAGTGEPPVRIQRAIAADALAAVLTHAHCFTLGSVEQTQRMMQHYLDLVAAVPVLRVEFRGGLENIPAILNAVEDDLHLEAPRPT